MVKLKNREYNIKVPENIAVGEVLRLVQRNAVVCETKSKQQLFPIENVRFVHENKILSNDKKISHYIKKATVEKTLWFVLTDVIKINFASI